MLVAITVGVVLAVILGLAFVLFGQRASKLPNAYFIEGILFWGLSLSKETVLSKGFYVDLPDLRGASVNAKNEFSEQMVRLLALLDEGWALQVQWMVDSDYSKELENYRSITEQRATNRWSKFVRTERYHYFKNLMDSGELRRERLALFFSKKASTVPKGGFTLDQTNTFLAQQSRILESMINKAASILHIGKITPMDDREHYLFAKKFFNPSILNSFYHNEDKYIGFDYRGSLIENCFFSDCITTSQDGTIVFKMDDRYQALLVITRWPQDAIPGIIEHLTDAISLDYSITQNIFPLNWQKEIEKEERSLKRVEGAAKEDGKQSDFDAASKKRMKITRLNDGHTRPFKVLTVIRTWDKTLEGLSNKTLALKSAIQGMGGAQFHQIEMAATARKLFYETFPGWLGGRYRAWDLYALSETLSDFIPMSSTFVGALEQGEALYHGRQKNLVGAATFSPNGTPQSAAFMGIARSGKSVMIQDLLSQTEPFFGFTGIIEEGLSYGTFTMLMGEQPIIIHNDSSLTLNYFDTNGTPLNPLSVGTATALCAKMAGMGRDEGEGKRAMASIARYINQLYWDRFEDWRKVNQSTYDLVCREAYVLDQFRRTTMPAGSGVLESFSELRSLKTVNPDRYYSMLNSAHEDAVLSFAKGNQTAADVRNLAFSYFKPEEFPTHTALVESMRYSKLDGDKDEEIDYLATMLTNWCRDGGSFGQLFDGATNFKITGKVCHFELGYISSGARELKEAAAFLIQNYMRTHVISMPRSIRKRLIYEEASRFLSVAAGQEIIAESYAQLPKFSAFMLTATQQYGQLKHSPIRPVIFGNSKQFFITKQVDRDDLQDIADAVGLPDTGVETIKDYVLPEHQKGIARRYSDVMSFSLESNIAGTIRNVPSDQLLWAASSSGEDFDKRTKAIAKYTDAYEAVMGETGVGGVLKEGAKAA